jgi:hypothetical protein
MQNLLTKWVSRSLFVLAVGTWLFYVGKLASWEWLTLCGAYLGYNLFQMFGPNGKPADPPSPPAQ